MTRLARIAAPFTAAVIAAGGCGGPATTARTAPTPASASASGSLIPVPSPKASTSTTIAVPAPPWRPPPAAITAADRYVTAALSSTWTETPRAWIAQVAPICTQQWAAALASNADGGGGGWAAIVTSRDTAAARVLAVYPSGGPGPGRRLEVTAQVTRTGPAGTSVATTALAVDLLSQPDGSWLVGWAG
ncbi:hypothetical protein K6U06_18930 [Acidiferrimicrobium sp. IK]|jgi:hypothetical protein|uniref:hypothetical protein n=1 Tax=Acidiferrimicrobium sp. IK TaxID=2871700 RepID=UPI0021CB7738|nr:hypothetical protein [Acidiferrimicrobium sp. IK]MCU4186450.1 hypothetical protein [Acidiferrimicrobium sp. IK]